MVSEGHRRWLDAPELGAIRDPQLALPLSAPIRARAAWAGAAFHLGLIDTFLLLQLIYSYLNHFKNMTEGTSKVLLDLCSQDLELGLGES